MTTQKHHDEAERIIRAAVYTLREPDETTGNQASFEDDVLTLTNSFDPPLANLLAAQEELATAKSEVADICAAMELYHGTRRVHGMTWSEAAKQVIEERDQLRTELATATEKLRKLTQSGC